MGESTAPSAEAAEPEVPELIHRKAERKGPSTLVLAIVVIVALVAVAAAAELVLPTKTGSSGTCPSGQTVNGAGSTFVAPLMDAWELNYTTGAINYEAVGSGTGIQQLQALAVDFAASDAPLTSFQVGEFSRTALTMPEASGAVVVIYNVPGLSTQLRVNGTWLALAFDGAITNWDDPMLQALNPGVTLPDQAIVVTHRSDGSGTSYVFQQFLSEDNSYWNSTYGYSTTWLGPSSLTGELTGKGSSGVVNVVATTPYAISYVDLTYAFTTGAGKVAYAQVENPSGAFISPTLPDTASAIHDILSKPGYILPPGNGNWSSVNMLNSAGAGDYPLATFTYLMFYENPEQAWSGTVPESTVEVLQNFLSWAIHQGQNSSAALYYAPLPPQVVSSDETTLSLVSWGSGPVPTCT